MIPNRRLRGPSGRIAKNAWPHCSTNWASSYTVGLHDRRSCPCNAQHRPRRHRAIGSCGLSTRSGTSSASNVATSLLFRKNQALRYEDATGRSWPTVSANNRILSVVARRPAGPGHRVFLFPHRVRVGSARKGLRRSAAVLLTWLRLLAKGDRDRRPWCERRRSQNEFAHSSYARVM